MLLDRALFFLFSLLVFVFVFVFARSFRVRVCFSSFGRVFCIYSSSCIVFLCRIWSIVVVGGGVEVVGGGFRVCRMVKRVLSWC
jgi:hypothetical protein